MLYLLVNLARNKKIVNSILNRDHAHSAKEAKHFRIVLVRFWKFLGVAQIYYPNTFSET